MLNINQIVNHSSSVFLLKKWHFVLVLLVNGCMLYPSMSYGHAPHDAIDFLALSPDYSDDKTVYVVVRNNLLKSTDGGALFKRVVKDLNYNGKITDFKGAPSHASVLYLTTDGNGIYKSVDQGESWLTVNSDLNDLNISKIAVSPEDAEFVLAASATTLYRTTNGGRSWSAVLKQLPITSISFGHPADSVISLGDAHGNFYQSDDASVTWKKYTPPGRIGALTEIVASARSPNTFYVGSAEGGVYRLKLSAANPQWIPMNQGLSAQPVVSIAEIQNAAGRQPNLLVSTAGKGVYQYSYSRQQWIRKAKGLTSNAQAKVKKKPHFGQLAYVAHDDQTLFLAGFNGLFKSNDGGDNWRELETLYQDIITGLALSPVYARDKTLAVNTYLAGTYLSHDGGNSWQTESTGIAQARYWSGLARMFDIAFSPNYAEDATIFSAQENHIVKSTDGGKHWQKISLANSYFGLRRLLNLLYAKLPFAAHGSQLFEFYFPTNIETSPNFKNDQTLFVGDRDGHLFRSEDGGNHYSIVSTLSGNINALKVSPNFSSDRTLYAIVAKSKIYRSHDAGSHWIGVASVAQQDVDLLNLFLVPGYETNQEVFLMTSSGLYKSQDAGEHWFSTTTADNVVAKSYISGFDVSPAYQTDQTLVVSVRGKGVYKSIDAGQSFTQIGRQLIDEHQALANFEGFPSEVQTLYFSPNYANDRTLVGSAGRRLYISEDGGVTWKASELHARSHYFSWPLFAYRLVVNTAFLQVLLVLLLVWLLKSIVGKQRLSRDSTENTFD